MDDSTAGEQAADELEELVAEALSRLEEGGEPAFEALCDAHPAEATRLRSRLRLLREAGLVEVPEAEAAQDFPERLGDFQLIERLGAGGMGVVYRARQLSLGREIALKLIRPEQLYFPGSRRRFAREVEAVARLAHPGIVPVHTVGEEAGIPYFAMEYVRGVSLDVVMETLVARHSRGVSGAELLAVVEELSGVGASPDEEGSPLAELDWNGACLWIAREVAQALEHAHQRSVLHRDVKPSNVMLTAGGRVLLLDFGLASTDGAQSITRTGSVLGSLRYMSPEQLHGESGELDGRADVHGLGVTLFELLALQPMFESESSEALIAQIIQGPVPTLRARGLTASRDLDAVVAMATAARRTDRYPSASDLARDLTALLENRPVLARPASLGTQLTRWMQRHKGAAAAAVLAVLLVVGAPLLFGWQQFRANKRIEAQKVLVQEALDDALRANERAEEQRGIAEGALRDALAANERAEQQRAIAEGALVDALAANERAEEQRGVAERNLLKALEAVELMLRRVGDETLADVPLLEGVRRELLAAAQRFYGELEELAGGDPAIRRVRARVGISLAHLDFLLGNLERAEQGAREQLAIFEELTESAAAEPVDYDMLARALGNLAQIMLKDGRAAQVSGLERRALDALSKIEGRYDDSRLTETAMRSHAAMAQHMLGQTTAALETMEPAIELARELVERQPTNVPYQRRLSGLLSDKGLMLLAVDASRAIEVLEEALERVERTIELNEHDTASRLTLSAICINLSTALTRLGREEEAVDVMERGVACAEELARQFPTNDGYRAVLATARVNLGVGLSQIDRREEALPPLRAAVAALEPLVEADPGNAEFVHKLGGALSNLSAILQELGRVDEALEPNRRALECARLAVEREPASPQYRFHLGVALINAGSAEMSVDAAHAQASDRFLEAVPLLAIDPNARFYVAMKWMEAATMAESDEALEEDERYEFADQYREEALAVLRELASEGFPLRGPLENDALWEPLREWPEFADLRASLTR